MGLTTEERNRRAKATIMAAIDADGGVSGLLQSVQVAEGIEVVYHVGLDTGVRFALAHPDLAQQFADEMADLVPADDYADAPDALAKAVEEWRFDE